MTPVRSTRRVIRAAQQKQIARGNAPWQTRANIQEVHADRGNYLTGIRYRERLDEILRKRDAGETE